MISPGALREMIDYDPETGVMLWKPRPREMFKTDLEFGRWNTRYAGRPALACWGKGYMCGMIGTAHVIAHRAAWALVHGEWPASTVVHRNGDKSDNRIANLRLKGVHWDGGCEGAE